MKNILSLLLLTLLAFTYSCTEKSIKPHKEYRYICNSAKTRNYKSQTCFLPETLEFEDSTILTKMPTELNYLYSEIFKSTDEICLSDCFIGNNTLRITILPTSDNIKIVSLIQKTNSDSLKVEIKELSQNASKYVPSIDSIEIDTVTFSISEFVTSTKWDALEKDIEGLFTMENFINLRYHDGVRILIEYHSNDYYWFVERQNTLTTSKNTEFVNILNVLFQKANISKNYFTN